MASMLTRVTILTTVVLALTTISSAQTALESTAPRTVSDDCLFQSESYQLKKQELTVARATDGIFFTAGMTIDADGAPNAYAPHNRGLDYTANARGAHGWVALVTSQSGHPVIQKHGAYRGYYVSTTSLQQSNMYDERDPKKYIDATKVPYIALPPDFAKRFNIILGDLALVLNRANGRSAYAIFADVGPKGRIGEGSIALAKRLGIPADPRHDSAEDGVTYLIFPGSALPADRHITARNIKSSAARLYHRWGGTQRLRSCELVSIRR
ncbi:MAG TPA: glycoside hydrolase family 75 protein [Candidatus Angelobacter sp.]